MKPTTATAIALQPTLNDIVFEHRNKAYGAYQLRLLYKKHLGQAILLAVGFFVLLFSVPTAIGKIFKGDAKISTVASKDTTLMVTVVMEKLKEVKPATTQPEAAPEPKVSTIKNTVPKVVEESKVVTDEIPTQEQLQTAHSGHTTFTGEEPGQGGNPMPNDGTGSGTGGGEGTAEPAPSIFTVVEQMPEYEGGLQKLMSYISKNIKYPRAALSQGIEGTVVLSFVVMPSGDIAQIEVLKGLGFGTEEEAIRVVSKMPRWKPGIQNGRAVPVKMTLPIRLELN
ncbi:energy transducer TonB [Rufibacter sp. LB8]|uniref:energy transducer TonB n=1 Tax=Rufibacter sp. LB8 TaxID=2777781 RepID=UPI00178C7C77|nr:energy transducer TonB [Rufibacter sp. LB8]